MKATDDLLMVRLGAINLRPHKDGSLLGAMKHNKRLLPESASSSIDPSRSHLNRALFNLSGKPEEVVARAEKLLAERGVKLPMPRIDSTIAAEWIFSLEKEESVHDIISYFSDCATWGERILGGTLLAADIHLDQDQPHCHVIVLLPLDGKTSGSKLIGYKQELASRVDDFFVSVGVRHGLRRPPPALSRGDKKLAVKLIHDHLRVTGDPILASPGRVAVMACVERHPALFLRTYGLQLPPSAKKEKTFEQHVLGRGKGSKTEAAQTYSDKRLEGRIAAARGVQADAERTYIDVECTVAGDPADDQHLCSVEVAQIPASSSASTGHPEHGTGVAPSRHPEQPQEAAQPSDRPPVALTPPAPRPARLEAVWTRHRDADQDPADYDYVTGECIPPESAPLMQAKAAAKAYVASLHFNELEAA